MKAEVANSYFLKTNIKEWFYKQLWWENALGMKTLTNFLIVDYIMKRHLNFFLRKVTKVIIFLDFQFTRETQAKIWSRASLILLTRTIKHLQKRTNLVFQHFKDKLNLLTSLIIKTPYWTTAYSISIRHEWY